MANIKSQKKRNITNEKRHQRNKAVRSSVKTAIRRATEAVEAGDKAGALDRAQAASRMLDKAASKGVLHANQAANRKRGVMKRVNAMEG
ncbi:MAG: 30S ribosomal protein S20 [Coriobacteriia bacterium]|nr:30S ribosomal protein S20 [Coriobacteriia bacterium]